MVGSFLPHRCGSVEESGLSFEYISELVLKTIYARGPIATRDIVAATKLAHVGDIDRALERLVGQDLTYVCGGVGQLLREYVLTESGTSRARAALARCPYIGPAPVRLAEYWQAVLSGSIRSVTLWRDDFARAFAHLEIDVELISRLGPADNAMRTVLVFGPTGNGKIALSEAITRVLPGAVWLPHALLVNNEIVTVFDAAYHLAMEGTDDGDPLRCDARWIGVRATTKKAALLCAPRCAPIAGCVAGRPTVGTMGVTGSASHTQLAGYVRTFGNWQISPASPARTK